MLCGGVGRSRQQEEQAQGPHRIQSGDEVGSDSRVAHHFDRGKGCWRSPWELQKVQGVCSNSWCLGPCVSKKDLPFLL